MDTLIDDLFEISARYLAGLQKLEMEVLETIKRAKEIASGNQ